MAIAPMNSATPCKLVIFDMDGTLVQSEDCASQAILDVVTGCTDSLSFVTRHYRGMRLAKIFSDIEKRFPGSVPDDWLARYREREWALAPSMVTASPDVELMLEQLRVARCIASNAPVEKTQRSLQQTGLAGYFTQEPFSAYQVNAWKPEPDLFLHAARQSGCEPEECVVVEDSHVGLQAALSAGMRTVYYDRHHEGHPYGSDVTSIHTLPDLTPLVQPLIARS